MYTSSPIWQLKKDCPKCGQGSLVLCTCEECQHVFAICDEDETIFGNPFDISLNEASLAGSEVCPHCGKEGTIRPSKDNELIKVGLTTDDYD